MLLVAFLRMHVRGELKVFRLNRIDKVFLAYALISATLYVLLRLSPASIANRLGFLINTLGLYFFFRVQVQTLPEIMLAIRTIAAVSVAISFFVLVELKTGRNLFSVFGGVPELTEMRQGNLRCQGSFAHPLIAGAFGATQIPIFAALLLGGLRDRLLGFLGIGACMIITAASACSGPLLAFLAGIVGLFSWPIRSCLRLVRWGSVFAIVGLALVMKAPVWALVGRVGIRGGSTGFHRYNLIDAAVRNFHEWWLMGVTDTNHWGYGLWDVTNQYIAEGVQGGLVSLVLFVTIITMAFSTIGRSLKAVDYEQKTKLFLWALGCSLFSHCVAFVGQHYFGAQSYVGLYLLFAFISGIYELGSLSPGDYEVVPQSSEEIAPVGNQDNV